MLTRDTVGKQREKTFWSMHKHHILFLEDLSNSNLIYLYRICHANMKPKVLHTANNK